MPLGDLRIPLNSGTSPGGVVWHAFPFAYNTPGLGAGVTAYTPTVGDLLLDALILIHTAWDGTTPKGDYGFLNVGGGTGWGGWGGMGAVDMTSADFASLGAGLLCPNSGRAQDLYGNLNSTGGSAWAGTLSVPAMFTAATPIKVVVSTDGTTGGADPGATQGSATLLIATATPA